MDVEQQAAVRAAAAEEQDKNKDAPSVSENRSVHVGDSDLLGGEELDAVLTAKMALVNDAIDEIGFTGHQWKLFCLNGFGYAVDSLILLLQSIVSTQAVLEFQPSFDTGLTIAVYVGMLVGALFWGFSADVIGRRFAFNVSLFISSVFTIVAGASPNWIVLGLFTCLSAFGAGGNLVLDTAVFLEYLPSTHSWLVTLMAAWWGVGQLIAGLFAWAFMPNYSCTDAASCTRDNNQGWRYVWYTSGAFVFVLSILRVTVVRLEETPKFLVSEGKDEKVVSVLQNIARKYNRPCSLTLERLTACGETRTRSSSGSKKSWKIISLSELGFHLRGLYATRKMGLSTTLVWFSWLLIGLAYPLFNVFLPQYLASRGAQFGQDSPYITWRNYAITNMCGIFGPILAGFMCRSPWFWGRRGTMIIGAMITMVFFFSYTAVRTAAQNVAFTCTINFCLNIYYGTLYAYTPEVLPSAHRGTGNGIAIGLNRIMGIISAIVGREADTSTSVPLYICAALYIVMAIVAGVFPFEPLGRRSS
ncbi:major facilitator superfamily domain-containing protein [Aspergillus pseudoustus]|uniref:Major facilitator superfamily domain-containing protein n=1 Tax=Aspergillus pseudoustus TaxID=1810923 RepID=A0ABR4K131_9EURO